MPEETWLPGMEAEATLSTLAQLVRKTAFRALLTGRVASLEELAAIAGCSTSAVHVAAAELRSAGLAVLRDGRVVGAGGLSDEPTPHRLRLGRQRLHTWCAYDAVGIPAALQLTATLITPCGYCGSPIRLEINTGRPSEDSTVVGWWPTGTCTNVREQFCSAANLFCTPDHLTVWHDDASKPTGQLQSLTQLAKHGRQSWAQCAQP